MSSENTTLFAAIASRTDSIGFKRYKPDEWASKVIVVAPDVTKAVSCEQALEEAASSQAVLLVLTPAIFVENKDKAGKLLETPDVKIFIHPSAGNDPTKTKAHAALDGLMKGVAHLESMKERTVAFSNGGKPAFRVSSLLSVWEWLCVAGKEPQNAPCPIRADLLVAYDRFWRRDNLQPIIQLAIFAQGIASSEVKEESRLKWISSFKNAKSKIGSAWIFQSACLQKPAEDFIQALNSSSEPRALEPCSRAFVEAARQFVAELNLGEEPNA